MYVPVSVRFMFLITRSPTNDRVLPCESNHFITGNGIELLPSHDSSSVSVSLTVVLPVISGGLKTGKKNILKKKFNKSVSQNLAGMK